MFSRFLFIILKIFCFFAKSVAAKVYVGQLQAGEVDFATRKREFGNLQAIRDNYPKYVISLTPMVSKNDNEGITHLHLRRFLTDGL